MNFKVGDNVVFINKIKHLGGQRYYPKPGTTGKIVFVDELCHDCEVQWEKGSTAQEDKWWCHFDDITLDPSDKPINVNRGGENDA